jgi:hypothetical protein
MKLAQPGNKKWEQMQTYLSENYNLPPQEASTFLQVLQEKYLTGSITEKLAISTIDVLSKKDMKKWISLI